MTILIVLGGIGVAGLIWALPKALRASTRRIKTAVTMRREFYRHSKPLLKADNVPLEVLDLLSFLNRHIDDASVVRKFVWYGISGKARESVEHPGKEATEFMAAVEQMPPELKESFWKALACGVLAITFSSLIAGLWIRSMMLFDIRRQSKSVATVLTGFTREDEDCLQAA